MDRSRETAPAATPPRQCSVYANARAIAPQFSATIEEIIEAIAGAPVPGADAHRELIAAIRAESDKGERNMLKLRLVAPTLSARFAGRRRQEATWEHTGWAAVDVDDLADLPAAEALRERARECAPVGAAYVSPSGKGVKLLCRVDPLPLTVDDHRDAAVECMAAVHEALGADIDPSGKDITRVCYVSHDPGAWYRESPPVAWERHSTERAPASRGRAVYRRLGTEHIRRGALPGDIAVGGTHIEVGLSPLTFHRVHENGRHDGLIRGARFTAYHGQDRRAEWQAAAEAHMGTARRDEIRDAIAWGHAAGLRSRETNPPPLPAPDDHGALAVDLQPAEPWTRPLGDPAPLKVSSDALILICALTGWELAWHAQLRLVFARRVGEARWREVELKSVCHTLCELLDDASREALMQGPGDSVEDWRPRTVAVRNTVVVGAAKRRVIKGVDGVPLHPTTDMAYRILRRAKPGTWANDATLLGKLGMRNTGEGKGRQGDQVWGRVHAALRLAGFRWIEVPGQDERWAIPAQPGGKWVAL